MLLQFEKRQEIIVWREKKIISQFSCKKTLLYWDSKSTHFTAYSEFQGSAENPTSGHALGAVSSTLLNEVGVCWHNTALCHKIGASTAIPAAVKTPGSLVWETWTRISTDGNILARKLREKGLFSFAGGIYYTFWNAVHYYWLYKKISFVLGSFQVIYIYIFNLPNIEITPPV